MPTDEVQIYVRVAGPSGEAWRPARARPLPGDVFEILEVTLQPGETPKFRPGDRVTCRPYELTDHDLVRVAHARADDGA
jgi:hypothetical protein